MNWTDQRDTRRIGAASCPWCGRACEGSACPDCEESVRESQAKWAQDEESETGGSAW